MVSLGLISLRGEIAKRLQPYMQKLRDYGQMTAKVAFCALWYTLTALCGLSVSVDDGSKSDHTQAIRAFLGSDVLGSLTLTKANWMRPSENSSIRSISSPSATSQPPV